MVERDRGRAVLELVLTSMRWSLLWLLLWNGERCCIVRGEDGRDSVWSCRLCGVVWGVVWGCSNALLRMLLVAIKSSSIAEDGLGVIIFSLIMDGTQVVS